MNLHSIFSLLALSALMACSSAGNTEKSALGEVYGLAKQKLAARGQSAPPSFDAAAVRDALIKLNQPFYLVRVERAGVTSLLALSKDRGDAEIWFSSDKLSLTLEGGVVTQTRGLGYDLYSAEASGAIQAIGGKSGSGQHTRTHRQLDGANAIQKTQYQCTISSLGQENVVAFDRSFAAQHLQEDCRSENDSFTNDYWIARDGGVIASRQRISPEYGFVRLERLSN